MGLVNANLEGTLRQIGISHELLRKCMKIPRIVPPLNAWLAIFFAVVFCGWNIYAEEVGMPFPSTARELWRDFVAYLNSGKYFKGAVIIGFIAGGLTASLWIVGFMAGKKLEPVTVRLSSIVAWLAVIGSAAVVASGVLWIQVVKHH